jgi:AcrR family transcriptional regulator
VRGRVHEDPPTALREHLIEVAERLLAERPAPTITTRDLARAAGVSDGVLYNYFDNKDDLIVTALVRRYTGLVDRFEALLPVPGDLDVADGLAAHLAAVRDLVAAAAPIAAGLVAAPVLLHRFIMAIHESPLGPQRLIAPIAGYLEGEHRLGRLHVLDPAATTHLLTGTGILLGLTGFARGAGLGPAGDEQPGQPRGGTLEGAVTVLLAGIRPL